MCERVNDSVAVIVKHSDLATERECQMIRSAVSSGKSYDLGLNYGLMNPKISIGVFLKYWLGIYNLPSFLNKTS